MPEKTTEDNKEAVEEGEFFPTPREVVYALLESPLVDLPGGRWIEPCAGTGRIISAVNEMRDDVSWTICELNKMFKPNLQKVMGLNDDLLGFGDFVHRRWDYPMADVLIMNPPFTLTMQFVLAAMKRARTVVLFQRQAWFGSKQRSPWLCKHSPDRHQLGWRPSFRPDGKVDNCDYNWYVWPEGSDAGRPWGISSMLPKPTGGQLQMF